MTSSTICILIGPTEAASSPRPIPHCEENICSFFIKIQVSHHKAKYLYLYQSQTRRIYSICEGFWKCERVFKINVWSLIFIARVVADIFVFKEEYH